MVDKSEKIKFKHLESFTSKEGYWDTLGCIDIAKDIIEITNIKSLLEIGFNIGYSANIWLQNGIEILYVIDINFHEDTLPAIKATLNYPDYYNKEIRIWLGDSLTPVAFDIKDFNLVDATFIDGHHSYIAVLLNTYLAINYGSKYIILDDVDENDLDSNMSIYKAYNKLVDLGLIELIKKYKMESTGGNGYIYLCKTLLKDN